MNTNTIVNCLTAATVLTVSANPVVSFFDVTDSNTYTDSSIYNLEKKHTFLYTRPVSYDPLSQKIVKICTLNYNWDGYGAVAPNDIVIANTTDFLKKIRTALLPFLNEENITPTPYGTIVLDFEKGDNLVSIEIGDKKIGYFTDFEDNENSESDGIDIIKNRHISTITEVLNKLVDA